MWMMVILLMYFMHMKIKLSQNSIGLMDICLKKINFVCLIFLCMNYLFVKLMRVASWVILVSLRLWMYCMNTFSSLKWDMMCKECVIRCIIYRKDKSKVLPYGLYTPLHVPKKPWVYIFMDFVLGLSRLKRGRDSIFYGCW
jgi:hypothetical protein